MIAKPHPTAMEVFFKREFCNIPNLLREKNYWTITSKHCVVSVWLNMIFKDEKHVLFLLLTYCIPAVPKVLYRCCNFFSSKWRTMKL